MDRRLLVLLAAGCAQDFRIDEVEPNYAGTSDAPALDAEVVQDVLVQRIPDALDVLWVVDNSQSMLAEQAKLANNFPRFVDFFTGSSLDWRVGVVSTDLDDPDQSGKLIEARDRRWVDPLTPDPVETFGEMVDLGRDGALVEQGRGAVYAAWTDPDAIDHNRGFFRDEADLAIVIVTDEDDKTRTIGLDAFLDWFDTLKPDHDMASISAIAGTAEVCGRNEEGVDYAALVDATGGAFHDICSANWKPVLEDLGVRAAGLSRRFFLTEVPDLASLQVQVDDGGDLRTFVLGDGFTYDELDNAIAFTRYTPPARAEVLVRYVPAGGAR